jgi:hypothetical protein
MPMEDTDLRQFIHDIRNALNSAHISAGHLRMQVPPVSPVILDRLDLSLEHAAEMVRKLESNLRRPATSS